MRVVAAEGVMSMRGDLVVAGHQRKRRLGGGGHGAKLKKDMHLSPNQSP